jgi:hypothetical protein
MGAPGVGPGRTRSACDIFSNAPWKSESCERYEVVATPLRRAFETPVESTPKCMGSIKIRSRDTAKCVASQNAGARMNLIGFLPPGNTL